MIQYKFVHSRLNLSYSKDGLYYNTVDFKDSIPADKNIIAVLPLYAYSDNYGYRGAIVSKPGWLHLPEETMVSVTSTYQEDITVYAIILFTD